MKQEYNSMDEKNLKKQVETKESFEKLFNSEDGKKVLSLLYRVCIPTIGEYEGDTHKAAFNEGTRHILMYILKLAEISKEVFFEEAIKDYESFKKEQLVNKLEWR